METEPLDRSYRLTISKVIWPWNMG